MTAATIHRLNQLNQTFYQQAGQAFDSARRHTWPGWHQLLPELTTPTTLSNRPRLLDLGCGNGRWAEFVHQALPDSEWQYWGVDSSQSLLTAARKHLAQWPTTYLTELDLVATLEQQTLAAQLQQHCPWSDQSAQAVSLFGVLHHIPSAELRQQLLQTAWQWVAPGGVLIWTTWQFSAWAQAEHRLIEPSQLGIDATDLEADDYILDWRRDQLQYRYCHELQDAELSQILNTLDFTAKRLFNAEGDQDNYNRYIVLTKAVT